MIQRIADLREPPVIGKYYLVPVIQSHPWHGKVGDWPVLGPMHEDREFFGFDAVHYHIDVRFLNKRLSAWAGRQLGRNYRSGDIDRDVGLAATGYPLADRFTPLPKGRPQLAKMRCARTGTPSAFPGIAREACAKMAARYGSPAPAIRKADGRRLCPHRKVDLSQFAADDDGVVICPLHGLRVCMREEAVDG